MGIFGGIVAAAGRSHAHGAEHVAQLHAIARDGDRAAGSLLPTAGNRFEVLEGAESFVVRLVQDVRAAEHQVNLTSYALHAPDDQGSLVQRVTSALIGRAQQGLPVTIVTDQVGSGLLASGVRRAQMEQLRDHGVDVRVNSLLGERGAIDHRKLYEIDGRISYQGGHNLVDGWLPWHDIMVRAEGPTAAQAGALLAGRWRDLGGTVTRDRLGVLEQGLTAPVADASHAALQLSNGNRQRRELTNFFIDGVRSAKERVWIANPYLGDPRAMSAVVDAARAGLDVRLLLAPKAQTAGQLQDVFTDPMRRAFAHHLADAGGTVVRVREFSHAKAWIHDDVATAGTFNLDLSSTVRNYENAISTTDPAALEGLERVFLSQQERGTVAAPEVVDSWRSLGRMRQRLGLRY